MITESYSASCYIENNNGEYLIDCDLQAGDKYAEANYKGNSLTTGLNHVIDSIDSQIEKQKAPVDPIKALEEKVAVLEAENKKLKNEALKQQNKNMNVDNKSAATINYNDLANYWLKIFGNVK